MKPSTTAVIYCRISRDEVGRAMGVARQERHCRELVEREGWALVDVISENNVSAYAEKRRKGYHRMLELVKNGLADTIVVWHPDRLHRSVRELEDFIDLLNITGASVATVTAGDLDLATPEGRLTARIQGAVARKESEDKSRRIRDKQLELAHGGKISGGGMRPYGYEKDRLTVVDVEAAIIREAVDRFLAGGSLRSICADFTDRGVPTSTGGTKWYSQVLRDIIGSARIAGQREHHGVVVADATWPAIISPAVSAQVRRQLADPARRRTRPARRYLLSGLVRCARCEHTMVSRPRTDGVRGYACQSGPPWYGCGRMFIQAEPLEAILREALIDALNGPKVASRLSRRGDFNDEQAVDDEAQALAQLAELADVYGRKVISLDEWMTARAPIEARLQEVRAAIGSNASILHLLRPGETPEARFRSLDGDVEGQRRMAAELIEYVPIHPHDRSRGRDFQPDRIGEPKWLA